MTDYEGRPLPLARGGRIQVSVITSECAPYTLARNPVSKLWECRGCGRFGVGLNPVVAYRQWLRKPHPFPPPPPPQKYNWLG